MSELFCLSGSVSYPTTKDYSQFKILCGNRKIKQSRVDKFVDSMKKDGVNDDCVIIVNRFGEIIDGQHRFCALKALDLPVPYMVIPNATVMDCIRMNADRTPWVLADFIDSNAAQGNMNYIALQKVAQQFSTIPIMTILKVITRRVTGVASSGKASKAIYKGQFLFPEDKYDEVVEELEYVKKFEFVRERNHHGNSSIFYNAIATCYECSAIDNSRLLERMTDSTERFGAFNTFKECLDRIQEVYNLYAHKNRLYLSHEVQQMLDLQRRTSKEVVA